MKVFSLPVRHNIRISKVLSDIKLVCEKAEIGERWLLVGKNLINIRFGRRLNIQPILFGLMSLVNESMLFLKS